jgi:exoribonuclease R
MKFQIFINDRNYSQWEFKDMDNEESIDIETCPVLKTVNPLISKLFSRDVIRFDEGNNLIIDKSIVKTTQTIAGVLVLENNKTYGRVCNNKRLLYKCIPDDKYLPTFLIPYDIKIGFQKKMMNKYVIFKYDHWNEKHPRGLLLNTLGNVDNLDVFYEYQLYCKSLHVSITNFTNKTRTILNKVPHDVYIDQIMNNSNFKIQDRSSRRIITIDPSNTQDFDDAFSIEPILENGLQIGSEISIYIANVFLWLETLDLWDTFSHRVSTIYLPDRKRPMLPSVLSDTLCSLQQKTKRFAFAFDIKVDNDGNIMNTDFTYRNVLIKVHKNYRYEETALLYNEVVYSKLYNITHLMDKRVITSHDVVSYWMIMVNATTGLKLLNDKIGIFRSIITKSHIDTSIDEYNLSENANRTIKNWNNVSGHYIQYNENAVIDHSLIDIIPLSMSKRKHKDLTPYVHVSSPIRRLIDLLNHIIIFEKYKIVNSISSSAKKFLLEWIDKLDYINISMRSIKKIQNECSLLFSCINKPTYLNETHNGVIFDKMHRMNGSYTYNVYLEELNLISRITTEQDMANYSKKLFKLFLFIGEDNIRKKIKLQLID